ncbi:hypothetical protein FJZ19_06105 [Candidatus Pacearchaeota archaeon]|nr:hypothetical protein [Candidatus Pacearchaeota archaeon]
MAKRDKKKVLLIMGIIAIAVIILVVFGFKSYKQNKAYEDYINNGNKFSYLNFKCVSECPVKLVIAENSTSIQFADNCISQCESDAVLQVPQIDKVEIKEKDYNRVLILDAEFVVCENEYNIEKNADRFKFCLSQILPSLKEKYNISL